MRVVLLALVLLTACALEPSARPGTKYAPRAAAPYARGPTAPEPSQNPGPSAPPGASGPTGPDAPPPPPPPPPPPVYRLPTAPLADLARGARGVEVVRLQFWLKLAAQGRLDEDGIFGAATSAMLHQAQARAGLPSSDVADAKVLGHLGGEVEAFVAKAWADYGVVPTFAVPSPSEIRAALLASPVIHGEGDKTAYYAPADRTGFAYGDGGESAGVHQGSTAHIDWVAGDLLSPAQARVIGVISRNEGPFVAVNSYDAGYYTWGAYQLIGAYRAHPYDPREDELGQGLAYQKRLDPVSFWYRFQRYGFDAVASFDGAGKIAATSLDVSLTRPDGSVLHGGAVWQLVGTDEPMNQVFIDAGKDPRIQRTHVLAAKLTHFDALDQPLKTGWSKVGEYFTSELLVAAFLDMELNMGRGTAKREFAEALSAVLPTYAPATTDPSTWTDRETLELAILEYTLAHPPSERYGLRAARLAQTVLLSSVAHSYQ